MTAMTPVALAGGTLTTWFGLRPSVPAGVPGQLDNPVAPAPLQVAPGRDNLMHARVVINGQAVDMIVDTGATRTLLSDRDARRVFGAARGQFAGSIRTISGEQPFYTLRASQVKLGGRLYRDIAAGRIEGGSLSVLGLDWLELAGPVTLGS